jgi:muramoyltetrapeptide carboxypeptidase
LIQRPESWNDKTALAFQSETIKSGKASGRLVGGNLSLVCSLMGTPYEIDLKNNILFLEEVGESYYRIDRMLTQLINSEQLKNCAGIAMGIFSDCTAKIGSPDGDEDSIQRVLRERLTELEIPIYYAKPIGHIDDNATLPIGCKVEFDADLGQLQFFDTIVE